MSVCVRVSVHGVRPRVHERLPVAPVIHGAVEERAERRVVLAQALVHRLADKVNEANLRQ